MAHTHDMAQVVQAVQAQAVHTSTLWGLSRYVVARDSIDTYHVVTIRNGAVHRLGSDIDAAQVVDILVAEGVVRA